MRFMWFYFLKVSKKTPNWLSVVVKKLSTAARLYQNKGTPRNEECLWWLSRAM